MITEGHHLPVLARTQTIGGLETSKIHPPKETPENATHGRANTHGFPILSIPTLPYIPAPIHSPCLCPLFPFHSPFPPPPHNQGRQTDPPTPDSLKP